MGYYSAGDYYAAGDWYAAGDPGVGRAIVKYGGGAIRKFMPGAGLVAGGLSALRHLERGAERSKIGRKVLKVRRKYLGRTGEVGMGRRYRRMNVCNPRALRRALRRAKGFEHFARKVVHLVTPKKRVSGFRFPRRKRK